MSYFSVNGLIGFFDLRNTLCDSSKERDALILEYKCYHDIKIHFFNNFYYLIDFSDSKIECARPLLKLNHLNDFKKAENSIAINLQKEAVNVLNACIYSI